MDPFRHLICSLTTGEILLIRCKSNWSALHKMGRTEGISGSGSRQPCKGPPCAPAPARRELPCQAVALWRRSAPAAPAPRARGACMHAGRQGRRVPHRRARPIGVPEGFERAPPPSPFPPEVPSSPPPSVLPTIPLLPLLYLYRSQFFNPPHTATGTERYAAADFSQPSPTTAAFLPI